MTVAQAIYSIVVTTSEQLNFNYDIDFMKLTGYGQIQIPI